MKDPISSEALIEYIHSLMEKGKKSRVKGWSMKDILEDVYENWGQGASSFTHTYIQEDYCGIKKDSPIFYLEISETKTDEMGKSGLSVSLRGLVKSGPNGSWYKDNS